MNPYEQRSSITVASAMIEEASQATQHATSSDKEMQRKSTAYGIKLRRHRPRPLPCSQRASQ